MVDIKLKRYYEDVAKKLSEKATQIRLSEKSTQGDIAAAYENAGDAYLISGNNLTAKKFYDTASKYAHDRRIVERMDDKLKGRSDIYDVKEKIRHLNASSLEKKAVEEPKKKKKKSGFWNFNVNWDRALKPNYPFETEEPRHYVFVALSIVSLLSALFFSTSGITGYAISNLTNQDSSWIGICLFVCGLIFTFIYLRQKDKF